MKSPYYACKAIITSLIIMGLASCGKRDSTVSTDGEVSAQSDPSQEIVQPSIKQGATTQECASNAEQEQTNVSGTESVPSNPTPGVSDPAEVEETKPVPNPSLGDFGRIRCEEKRGGLNASSIVFDFWYRVSTEEFRSHLEIEPSCTYQVTNPNGSGYEKEVRGEFVPGQTYTITLRKGMKSRSWDNELRELQNDFVQTVTISDRIPSIALADQGCYLAPTAQSALLRFKSINTPTIQVCARKLRDQNFYWFLRKQTNECGDRPNWWNGNDPKNTAALLGGATITQKIDVASAPNELITSSIDLKEMLAPESTPHGAYLVTASKEEDEETSNARVIVLSDIGLSVRYDKGHGIAWTTSLTTGKPLAGVNVRVGSRSNDEVARVTTDELGCAEFHYQLDFDDALFIATASLGDDLTFVPLSDASYNATPATGHASSEARTPAPGTQYEALFVTPRGIVRPSETLPFKVVLRDLKGTIPVPFPVGIALVRPDGRDAITKTVLLSTLGTAEAEFTLDRGWPTGAWSLQARLPGSTEVLGKFPLVVEEIVPPQIKVTFEGLPEDTILTRKSTLSFTLQSEFLFGAAAAELPAQCSYEFVTRPFAPKGWGGYRFGDEGESTSRILATKVLATAPLNDEGKSALTLPFPILPTTSHSIELALCGSVQQAGGRTISNVVKLPVASTPFYMGLRNTTQGTVYTQTPTDIEVALVAPDGTPATTPSPTLRASLELIERTWNWNRDEHGDWHYLVDTDIHPFAELPSVTPTEGKATLPITFDQPGSYRLRLTDPATSATTTLDIEVATLGVSWVHSGTENPALISLSPSAQSFAPGETIELNVKAPFAGEGMLFLEGAGGAWRHIPVTLDQTATLLSFTSEASDFPSLRASLVLLQPLTPKDRNTSSKALTITRAIGTCLIPIAPKGREITLDITAPEETLPQSQLSLQATLLDADQQPVPHAEVTLVAVDEALCMLTRFHTPDPLAWAHTPRWINAAHYDPFSRLLPLFGATPAPDSHIGGDAALAPHRFFPGSGKRFQTVALWKGTIYSDAQGRVSADFDLPEFSGSLRIMAIAIGTSAQNTPLYGATEKRIRVRRPITTLATLPRFAAPGDAFDATLELFNTTQEPQSLSVTLTPPATTAEKPIQHTLTLEAGARKVITERLSAPAKPGSSDYTFCATLDSATAPFYTEIISLPIRPAVAYSSTERHGTLQPGEKVSLSLDDEHLLFGTATLTASRRPDVSSLGALDFLIHYPYGCLEQITSQSFPLLYLKDIAASAHPELFDNDKCAQYIQAGINKILAKQRPDGGFSLWDGERNIYPWGSLYASQFLFEAKKAGYPVPEKNLREAADFAVSILRDTSKNQTSDIIALRSFAVHIATLAGRHTAARPWLDRLYEQHATLPHEARAHVAASLALGGRPREALALFQDLAPDFAHNTHDPEIANDETHTSSVRDLALLLNALCDLNPTSELAPTIVSEILLRRQPFGSWYTTTENAMVLLALGKYYRATFGAYNPNAPYQAAFTLDDNPPKASDLTRNLSWSGSANSIELHNPGTTPFYYSILARGIPSQLPPALNSHFLAIERTYLDLASGKPIPLNPDGSLTLKRGDALAVRIQLTHRVERLPSLVLSDLLPAGLEIENPALATSAALPPWLKNGPSQNTHFIRETDLRDDRFVLFTHALNNPNKTHTLYYSVRAVTPGTYTLPSLEVEAMYQPEIHARTAPSTLTILP